MLNIKNPALLLKEGRDGARGGNSSSSEHKKQLTKRSIVFSAII